MLRIDVNFFAAEEVRNKLVLLEFEFVPAFAECDCVVTLIGRVVCLEAVDCRIYKSFVNLFGEPEHTGGKLLHEDYGNIAFSIEEGSGSKVFGNIDLVEEFNCAGFLVDEHIADVGHFAALEGYIVHVNGFFCVYGSFAHCNTNEVLGNFTGGSSAVTVRVSRHGRVEVNACGKNLRTGYDSLDFSPAFAITSIS